MMMTKVFVYGTLKQGYDNNLLLTGSKFLGCAVTRELFRMWCVGFPHIADDPKGCAVSGEVYLVDEVTLARLDQLESNGRMYQRRPVRIRLQNGRFDCAWAYIGKSFGDSGQPVLPGPDKIICWEAY